MSYPWVTLALGCWMGISAPLLLLNSAAIISAFILPFIFSQRKILLLGAAIGIFLSVFSYYPKPIIKSGSWKLVESLSPLSKEKSLGQKSKINWNPKWKKSLREMANSPHPLLQSFRETFIFGETKSLPNEIWKDASILGISHLFVISGSHIGFIILLLRFILQRLLLRPKISWKIFRWTETFLLCFCLSICEFNISLLRALVGYFLVTLIPLWFPSIHRYSWTEKVGFVATLLLITNPMEAWSRSFILSVAASFVLVQTNEWKSKPSSWAVMMIPSFFLIPILSLLNLGASSLSFLWNLLLGPIFMFVVVPFSLLPFGGTISVKVLTWFFNILENLALFSSKTDFKIYTSDFLATLFSLALLILVLIKSLSLKTRVFLMFAILVVMTFSKATNLDLRIEVFDVGQGDGLMIRRQQDDIIVDGGSSRGGFYISQQLISLNVREPLGWILSHFDEDHIGQFLMENKKWKLSHLWVPWLDKTAKSRKLKETQTDLYEGTRLLKNCDQKWCIYSKNTTAQDDFKKVGNGDSLITWITKNHSRELLWLSLGDLDEKGELLLLDMLRREGFWWKKRKVIIKLGHHGSKTSTSKALLDKIHPRQVWICLGRNNSYGFPHEQVLEKLENYMTPWKRTDLEGNFKLDFD